MSKKDRCLAILRLRGNVNICKELAYVFKLLHLTRKHHMTVLRPSPTNLGMISKMKDYLAWGEVSQETLIHLLKKRGFLKGNKRLTDANVKESLGFPSIEELANAIYEIKVELSELTNLKPIFRLHPPKGGFHGTIKKPYPQGELGYRGEKINRLILRMI